MTTEIDTTIVRKFVDEQIDYGKFAILVANINLIKGIDISERYQYVCDEVFSGMDEDTNIHCIDVSYGDYLTFIIWIE